MKSSSSSLYNHHPPTEEGSLYHCCIMAMSRFDQDDGALIGTEKASEASDEPIYLF